ncbi:MAG: hypothetical protein ACLSHH_03920 [Clostridia bacterium]
MEKQKGITMISLVITIIILIILAGVSINILVGDNGIITMTKKAKQNVLSAQEEEAKNLNRLYEQISYAGTDGESSDTEAAAKLLQFKKAIAAAITKEGVATMETDTQEVMVSNIGKILKVRTKDATATPENITQGKTAWVDAQKITGNGTDISNAYNSGYHDGKKEAEKTNTITIPSLIIGGQIYDRSIYPYCVINTASCTSMSFSMAAAHPYCYFYVIGTKENVEVTLLSQEPSVEMSDFEKSPTFDITGYEKITFKITPYGNAAGGVIISNLVIS